MTVTVAMDTFNVSVTQVNTNSVFIPAQTN